MKIQNLSLIFLVIMIPLIMVLSYYMDLQQDTLILQSKYDTKLAEATKEAIKAFEVNTVEWSEWVSDKTRVTERDDVRAAINTFITSLSNNLNLSGTAKEYMSNYIPAVAMTMYDGYYIYAPNYVPETIRNGQGLELYYDEDKDILTTSDGEGLNSPIFKPKDGMGFKTKSYTYIDDENNEITENISFVTNLDAAENEYSHTLSSQIAYTARYAKTNTNVVVNYTLDNRIYLYGTVNNQNEKKEGYLVYFDTATTSLPKLNRTTSTPTSDSHITISESIENTKYNNIDIDAEYLEEQVLYKEGGIDYLKTFNYIYDSEHQKLYYDENEENFFTYSDTSKERNFILNNETVTVGSVNCKYKSVSILYGTNVSTTEYKKAYQVLNGKDKGKWYINIKDDSVEAVNEKIDEIDINITDNKLLELGLSSSKDASNICKDYSAISYYVESFSFTNWAKENLGGLKIYKPETAQYEEINIDGKIVDNIFEISKTNNPEDENSSFVIHKKTIMKNNIITNLNLAISNYSRGKYNYRLPILKDGQWEQIFSNISIITFFQGVPIGLKYYNNYAIATSTSNREFVDPNEIYLSGEDNNYHKVYCEKASDTLNYTGYRNIEYSLRNYSTLSGDNIYYYQHDSLLNNYSETACYYCIINKANYIKRESPNQTKAYFEALARERYYQNEIIRYAGTI